MIFECCNFAFKYPLPFPSFAETYRELGDLCDHTYKARFLVSLENVEDLENWITILE